MEEQSASQNFHEPCLSIADIATFLNVSTQAIHKRIKERNLSCLKKGNKGYINHTISRLLFPIQFKFKRVVIQMVKGGVGKTTTLINIASLANALGARVLIIDLDPQGNLTDACGVDAEERAVLIDVLKNEDIKIEDCLLNLSDGFDLIPSRIENVILDSEIMTSRRPLDKFFENILKKIANNYNFIFFDCPATLGHSVTAATLYGDVVLAPLNPDKFSAKGLKILKNEIKTLNDSYNRNIDYRVYLNKFSAKTILSDKAVISLIGDKDLEGRVLSTTIPFSQEVPNITDGNKNLFSTLRKSAVRNDFNTLALELLEISSDDISNSASVNHTKGSSPKLKKREAVTEQIV